eukprot:TRINITY_DN11639_c0_g1_i1.p1 TRINITY_DN11639_c0_g1~~TRINITY_DN11639_c0_g1_i1.p1  ORF type:complete len:148 (+),score=31.06 TRINITY_DN11639_c0_g1_i1:150-593(+)
METSSSAASSSQNVYIETPDKARLRFLMELEFVQCLASPEYLQFLAQQRYFKEPAFIGYLHYLLYWEGAAYSKFLVHPQCLYFLQLLQDEKFRQSLSKPETIEWIHCQQFHHWRYYRAHRMAAAAPLATAGPSSPTSSPLPTSDENG